MRKLVQRTMGSLAAQFVLGMTLNVLGQPSEIGSSLVRNFYYLVLVLHILNAVWLVVAAVLIWRQVPAGPAKKVAGFAAGSLVVAFIAGSLTAGNVRLHELWSFVMAMGFLATFRFYGRVMGLISRPTE